MLMISLLFLPCQSTHFLLLSTPKSHPPSTSSLINWGRIIIEVITWIVPHLITHMRPPVIKLFFRVFFCNSEKNFLHSQCWTERLMSPGVWGRKWKNQIVKSYLIKNCWIFCILLTLLAWSFLILFPFAQSASTNYYQLLPLLSPQWRFLVAKSPKSHERLIKWNLELF